MKKVICIALCALMTAGSVIGANATTPPGIVSYVDVLDSKINTKNSTINFYTYNIDSHSSGGAYFMNTSTDSGKEIFKVKFKELIDSPQTFNTTKGAEYYCYKTLIYGESHNLKKFNFDDLGDEYVKVSVNLSYLDRNYFTTRGYHWGYTHNEEKLFKFMRETTDTGFLDSTLYFISGNVVSAASPDEKGRVEVYIRTKIGSPTTYSTYFVERKNNKNNTDIGVSHRAVEKLTFGNIDLTGDVDVNDVTALQQYLVGSVSFDNLQSFYADVNRDGLCNVSDVTQLQQELLK